MDNTGLAPEALHSLMISRQWQVCGVFSSGIYLQDLSGEILLVHDSSYGLLPFGIGIPKLGREAKSYGIEQGMKARFDPDDLFIIIGSKFRVRVTFCNTERLKNLHINDFILKTEEYLTKSELNSLFYYACHKPNERVKSEIDELFASTAFQAMNQMDSGLEHMEQENVHQGVLGLLGLGRGLTPSCDDYLTGMLSAWNIAERESERASRLFQMLAFAVRAELSRTNIFSAAYLRAAATRQSFSLMQDCLELSGVEQKKAIERLAAVGGSSGTDMLAGMLHACKMLKLA